LDIQENWDKALRKTEIVRTRLKPLGAFSDTEIPYTFLSESLLNKGDTVVRSGSVIVTKPSLILPDHLPQLFGFDFEKMGFNDNSVVNFFLLRGIHYPTLKYTNESYSLDIFEGNLGHAKKKYANELQRKEDIHTGLVIGPDDTWAFSVLIFVATVIERTAGSDITKMIDQIRKKR